MDTHTAGQMLGLRARPPGVNMHLETQSRRASGMDGASERVGGLERGGGGVKWVVEGNVLAR
jgi:hypothetical protein